MKTSQSLLRAVFVTGIAVTITTMGCEKKASPPPSASATASKTTDQIMRENPELKKSVVSRMEAQIQQSNLPPQEKERQIAKLRAEGPPR